METVARELSKYKLDLEGIQEVRWDKGGSEPADSLYIFLWNHTSIIIVLCSNI
jgi:hypothetical protein